MSRHRFMLDVKQEIKFDNSLVDGWFFNGTNNNFPTSIVGINGNEMILYGFDGTIESGFNNGLQFDGVDDYTKVSGLPILNDFTVICHREILSNIYWVASKAEVWNNGAFILEASDQSNGGGRSFGTGITNHLYLDKSEQAIAMTPTNYYGKNRNTGEYNVRSFSRGDGLDTEYLWLGKIRDSVMLYTQMNIKYFLLYNKTLSEEEIQSEIEKAEKKFLE